MRMNARKKLVMLILFGMISIKFVRAQQNGAPKDDDVNVIYFEDAKYPAMAQQAGVQGSVVVQVKLDDQGRVTDAMAISGSPILAPPALNNVKKWRFRPNARKSAVIVYNFIFLEGRCESHGSLFVLQPSNLATVIGCSAVVSTSSSQ